MRNKFYILMDEAGNEGGTGGDVAEKDNESQSIDPTEFERVKSEYTALSETLKKLEANNQALVKEKIDAKKKAEQAAMEAAKKSGDVETIEKSWGEKYAALESEKTEAIKQYETMIHNLTVGAAASSMAAEIAVQGSASILLPHIERRLTVEIRDGKAVTKVLDKEGRPSAMTIEELKKELITDKAFAPVIAGTKASGTGYRGGDWSGGDGNKVITRNEFDSMPLDKRTAISADIRTGKIKLVDA